VHLLAGVWNLKGIRSKRDKGRCLLCLYKGDVEYNVVDDLFRNQKLVRGIFKETWLNMKE
jgi:hypothetical protein